LIAVRNALTLAGRHDPVIAPKVGLSRDRAVRGGAARRATMASVPQVLDRFAGMR
jgi:hypothetical protein